MQMLDSPEAIMINVPESYFLLNEKWQDADSSELYFRQYYEAMGTARMPEACFYHFISTIPKFPVFTVFVCYKGKVQYKARLVEFLRNQPVSVPGLEHPEPRNWCVTTGPVEKAPYEISQQGFRGFRYCKMLY